ncbi:hypothetical protein [Pseudooceanicola sp.]|jgi:hypothetical protein|uniref:hypothetical protein n=1 Tax=Pseudooceanicola sp. TaxID=1914328 RepID=UPI0040590CD6
MRRAATLVIVLTIATASAAWAAYSSLPMDDLVRPQTGDAGVIVIRVPAEDVSRCVVTLMQVMQMPLDPEFVTAIDIEMPAAPMVRCEAE